VIRFALIDAKPYHCGQMCRRLRHEHQEASLRLGLDAHRELSNVFRQSYFAKAYYADDKMIALGGVIGDLVSPFGFVWLAITEDGMRRHPVALVREAQRQLDNIMTTKRELITTIIGGDERSKRLAVFLGFHVSHGDRGEPAYSKWGRRDLGNYIDSEPSLRLPVGNGYAIRMGYH
jgi:hypothetical protein